MKENGSRISVEQRSDSLVIINPGRPFVFRSLLIVLAWIIFVVPLISEVFQGSIPPFGALIGYSVFIFVIIAFSLFDLWMLFGREEIVFDDTYLKVNLCVGRLKRQQSFKLEYIRFLRATDFWPNYRRIPFDPFFFNTTYSFDYNGYKFRFGRFLDGDDADVVTEAIQQVHPELRDLPVRSVPDIKFYWDKKSNN